MANTNYKASDIKTLEGIAHIRLRPGMYIGSTTVDGIHHITLEILTNFIDEYLNGYGDTGKIGLSEDGFITIVDNARGIPIGTHSSGKSVLQAVFDTPNTGGKFDNNGESGYNTSGGMNGIGAKATNALSVIFIAQTKRDGQKETVIFEKGELKSHSIEPYEGPSGTTVKFKPDPEIFKEATLDFGRLQKQVHELAFLCSGLLFVLKDQDEKVTEYKYENGILDYVKHLVGKNQPLTSTFYCSSVEGRIGVEVGMAYTNAYSETFKAYTNNIPNTSGTHLTGFRSALTRAMNEYARDKKLLKEKEDNLTGDDLKEGLTFVLSLKMPDPVFSGQTKEVLTSSEGRTMVERLVAKEIRVWLENHPNDAKAIVNKALLAKKSRDAAKKAREATRKKSGGSLGGTVLPGKLADCSSKNVDECEIYLVEGDSAGGSAKQARDRATQAILPLRGKVINAEKKDFSKLLENKEIKDMITAFGCGISQTFNIDGLRYGKIIIMTDGDVDGAHIRTLLLTFLYKYFRPLIESGHVYAAMPPLYRVVKNKEAIYLQDDSELAEYKAKHKGENLTINRFKGLGEMNPDQLEETTMGKETRRLKQITIKDFEKTGIVFNQLMGPSVEPRRQFISANAYKANLDN